MGHSIAAEMRSGNTLSNPPLAAIGFRVKSGWAAWVLLTGPVQAPRILGMGRVELSDPSIPESLQPYHAGTGALETDEANVSGRIQIVRRSTRESVTKLLQNSRSNEYRIRNAALVVGSTVDPDSIANPHIRAHAFEGQLFRTVLQEALSAQGLRCSVVVERRAFSEGAAMLALSEVELRRRLSNLGREQSGPWRSEQKMAALVAWMALAEVA